MSDVTPSAQPRPSSNVVFTALRLWLTAYKVEVALFAVSFLVLTFFSGPRFLRQSGAPHFVYQAQAWLEGRIDIDPQVLPNFEDWACVRGVGGEKVRCSVPAQPTDKWYVSFPSFPSVLMLPFVALHGYQFNDTSFTVFIAALSIALFYSLLRLLQKKAETERTRAENVAIALLLAFGTLFFYCAIRGEVWFTAEVMGVGLTTLYVRNAVGARRPWLAGLYFSMAVLTRTPLLFSGVFFVLEAICPGPNRLEQLKALRENWQPALRKLARFAGGMAPLAVLGAINNYLRFGKLGEFGHSFLFNNRVNVDIDRFGLFNLVYLGRNLEAAFFKLPLVRFEPTFRLGYDPHGLSLLLTLPILVFLLVPKPPTARQLTPWAVLVGSALPGLVLTGWLGATALKLSLVLMVAVPAAYFAWKKEDRPNHWQLWLALGAIALLGLVGRMEPLLAFRLTLVLSVALLAVLSWLSQTLPRLHWSLWLTVAVTALPGLVYQNTGYAQFGFRFSLDYTPYLMLLFAIGAWKLSSRWVMGVAAFGALVNFWGAVAFSGYTEMLRR